MSGPRRFDAGEPERERERERERPRAEDGHQPAAGAVPGERCAERDAARRQILDARLRQARRDLEAAQEETGHLRRALERQARRADRFRAELKGIHGALAGGDVFALVLHSCLRLTGATRGLYVSDAEGAMRVRAAIGVDGYGQRTTRPSSFVTAVARRVLEVDDTIVAGDADTHGLPAPVREEERFACWAAVPVAVRGDVHGVVLVADKAQGMFDEEDIETLLHVGDQAAVAVDNAALHHELERAYVGTVGMLADAVEAKDPYTRGHCQRVSRMARLTGERLGLAGTELQLVCLAALLHDVGKIGVSDGILNKPGPLLPEERDVVKAHVRIGHDLLRSLPALAPVSEVVLHHHESFDGTGYPDGLRGEEIPVGSRIVAVIDAFCAMLDERAYKQPRTEPEARAELARCAGSQFDPRIVDALFAVLDSPDARAQIEGADGECGLPVPPRVPPGARLAVLPMRRTGRVPPS